jgi:hypothetical protein
MTFIIGKKTITADWIWLAGIMATIVTWAFMAGIWASDFKAKQDDMASKINYLIAVSRDKTKKDSTQDIAIAVHESRISSIEQVKKTGYLTETKDANGKITTHDYQN